MLGSIAQAAGPRSVTLLFSSVGGAAAAQQIHLRATADGASSSSGGGGDGGAGSGKLKRIGFGVVGASGEHASTPN